MKLHSPRIQVWLVLVLLLAAYFLYYSAALFMVPVAIGATHSARSGRGRLIAG